jgi:malonate-semialdehyde dehydrogenase (acetylating)/methylmalonate-semialdehyde dehydrogenase
MAISVAVAVGKQTADNLLGKLEDRIAKLRVDHGAPGAPEADFGPLITGTHRDKVSSYIDLGKTEGAELVVDGRAHALPQGEGFFLGACLFDHVKPEMRIYKEEIFGPVLGVVRVNNFEKALELINEHEYGNGTSIFTRDGDTARDFGRRVQAGMVGINVPIPVPMAFHSFGGWKRSLFGDHGIYGPEGVRFYTRLKTITARWPTGIRTGVDTSMPTLG